MAVGVNARTAFSLLFPSILDEFGWDRGVTAGAFSFGFLASAALSPFIGRLMDHRGPRVVIEIGVAAMTAGLLLATLVRQPWHLYATLGMLVGAGSIIMLPRLQTIIGRDGWRAACWARGILVLALLAPLNLLLKRGPEELGLEPDGDRYSHNAGASSRTTNVVDPAWVAVDWTLVRALRTPSFLVDRGGICHEHVRLVHGAGPSDEIPRRDRVLPDRCGLGAGIREPRGHPRADRARTPLRPNRAGMGLDGRQPGLRSVLPKPWHRLRQTKSRKTVPASFHRVRFSERAPRRAPREGRERDANTARGCCRAQRRS